MSQLREALSYLAASVVFLGFVACNAPTGPGTGSTIVDVSAKLAQTAAAITGQNAPFANDAEKGRSVGFDTHTYPGDATMKAWKNTPGSPYKWVGFYLPSPCHADASWSGKRDELKSMGWGVAVVYVGEQTWGHGPRNLTTAQRDAIRGKSPCSADLLTTDEGVRDGLDAAQKAAHEGFAKGTIVFLDIERMQNIPGGMRDYYKAWVSTLLQDGRFTPGVYTHQFNAQTIYDDVNAIYVAAGRKDKPRFWIAGGKGFDTGRAPQDVGYAFAGVWQGVIDVARSVAKIKLPVDVNVASWRSPSESGVTTD